MREFILTDDDRRRLVAWLEGGEEDQVTRNLFSVVRRSFPRLVSDIRLLINVRRRLRSEGRWGRRFRVPPGFRESLLRRMGSGEDEDEPSE